MLKNIKYDVFEEAKSKVVISKMNKHAYREYDSILKGKVGSISKITDASGRKIEKGNEEYISPQDGDDIVLTIDASIQGIAEKYLKEACVDNKCEDGRKCNCDEP